MPAKKRTTRTTTATATPAPVTPALTPDAVLASKKEAAAPKAEKKPAAKRPATKRAKAALVAASEVVVASAPETVVEVPVVADAPVAQVRSIISEDDIRRHAYKLSQSRKGPGDPIADWFEAERQLREQHA